MIRNAYLAKSFIALRRGGKFSSWVQSQNIVLSLRNPALCKNPKISNSRTAFFRNLTKECDVNSTGFGIKLLKLEGYYSFQTTLTYQIILKPIIFETDMKTISE